MMTCAFRRPVTHLILLLSVGLVSATSAQADPGDDYVACLIGGAAIVLHKQDRKDSGKALEGAYKRCKEPKGIAENELEGISDYVALQVEAMASQP